MQSVGTVPISLSGVYEKCKTENRKAALRNRSSLLRIRFRLWEKFSFCFRIQTIFSTVFPKTKKIAQNLAFSMSEAVIFLKKLASHFEFFYFFISIFYVRFGSKSGTGTGSGSVMHSGSAKEKSCDSCGSGSTTLVERVPTKLYFIVKNWPVLSRLHGKRRIRSSKQWMHGV